MSTPTTIKASLSARTPAGVWVALWLAVAIGAGCGPAVAQGFQWPWEGVQPTPRPREQLNRPPPAPIPAQPAQPGAAPGGQQWMQRNPVCGQLEARLAQETQRGAQARDALPKVEADLQQSIRTVQQGEQQLEKSECYEYFLFSKSLRNTRQCRDIAGAIDAARRRQGDLETQRQQILGSGGHTYAEDITRELARNNCGPAYQQQQQANVPGAGSAASVWQDGEGGSFTGGFGSSQYATYRTVCVRLCDGYYFPISFATLPGRFNQDVDACQSKCAAPVELYYHPNPGGAMEQAMSVKSQEPYTRLKTAFRYRREFVQGCSCKEAEYVPPAGTIQAPLPVTPPAAGADKRAETLPWEKPVTSPR